MEQKRDTILAELRSQILRLEGFRTASSDTTQRGIDPIRNAFPGGIFPLGCVHEFLWSETENFSATGAFIASLIPAWIRPHGVIVWISTDRKVMPSALPVFGVAPDHILFIQVRDKDALWVTEEALKSKAVTAVVAELRELSFTNSRRLQLAVEQSQTTGFVIRQLRGNMGTTACVSRWKITHRASQAVDSLPGIGYPSWQVDLLRVRNGKPASWQVYWSDDHFEYVERNSVDTLLPQAEVG